MEKTELYNRVNESLQTFDSLKNIEAGDDWNEGLRLKLSKGGRKRMIKQPTFAVVAIVVFVSLLNLSLGVTLLLKEHKPVLLERRSNLELISKELLINPIAANN